jgi:hypothetical protein
VKGRKKEKRLKKGMNAEPKRKNKCRICKSTDHNAARCSKKAGEERLGIESDSVQQLPSHESEKKQDHMVKRWKAAACCSYNYKESVCVT